MRHACTRRIDRELPDLAKQGVRTRFFGRRDRIPVELQEKMARLEAETAHLERLQLWIASTMGAVQSSSRRRASSSWRGSNPRTFPRRPWPTGCMHPSSVIPIS